jgi:hypothetical protein
MTPSELELAENLANEHGEFEAADRRLLRKLLEDRAGLVERLGQAEADADLALDGLPDPMHPRFTPEQADKLTCAQILIMNLAGHDDPGNVEASRAALVSSSIPKETEA